MFEGIDKYIALFYKKSEKQINGNLNKNFPLKSYYFNFL